MRYAKAGSDRLDPMSRADADLLLDSDVVIWLLRGRQSIVDLCTDLASSSRLGISVITWSEVLAGMRESERGPTYRLLESYATLGIDQPIARRAGEIMLAERRRGTTLHVPDSLIGATAIEHAIPLYTCNPRHYPMAELDLRSVVS